MPVEIQVPYLKTRTVEKTISLECLCCSPSLACPRVCSPFPGQKPSQQISLSTQNSFSLPFAVSHSGKCPASWRPYSAPHPTAQDTRFDRVPPLTLLTGCDLSSSLATKTRAVHEVSAATHPAGTQSLQVSRSWKSPLSSAVAFILMLI